MTTTEIFGDSLPARLRRIIADKFRLNLADVNKIPDDAPLIDGSLGLDSLDALELAMSVEEEFGIIIGRQDEWHRAFGSLTSLTDFVRARSARAGMSLANTRSGDRIPVPMLARPLAWDGRP